MWCCTYTLQWFSCAYVSPLSLTFCLTRFCCHTGNERAGTVARRYRQKKAWNKTHTRCKHTLIAYCIRHCDKFTINRLSAKKCVLIWNTEKKTRTFVVNHSITVVRAFQIEILVNEMTKNCENSYKYKSRYISFFVEVKKTELCRTGKNIGFGVFGNAIAAV